MGSVFSFFFFKVCWQLAIVTSKEAWGRGGGGVSSGRSELEPQRGGVCGRGAALQAQGSAWVEGAWVLWGGRAPVSGTRATGNGCSPNPGGAPGRCGETALLVQEERVQNPSSLEDTEPGPPPGTWPLAPLSPRVSKFCGRFHPQIRVEEQVPRVPGPRSRAWRAGAFPGRPRPGASPEAFLVVPEAGSCIIYEPGPGEQGCEGRGRRRRGPELDPAHGEWPRPHPEPRRRLGT